MLDSIRFRKLENGYTVKWHIQLKKDGLDVAGQSTERFFATAAEVSEFISDLALDNLAA